jgi:hypothetical protein
MSLYVSPISHLFWVSSLAYHNLFGTKDYVVVVAAAHSGSDLTQVLVFFLFILKFNSVILSIVSDVPLENETSVVTSLILKFTGGAYRVE